MLSSHDIRDWSRDQLCERASQESDGELIENWQGARFRGIGLQSPRSEEIVREKEEKGVCDSLARVLQDSSVEAFDTALVRVNLSDRIRDA